MSAIWSLTGAKRTSQVKLVSVAIDSISDILQWHETHDLPMIEH